MADILEDLIDLERRAEEERAKLAGLDGEAYDEQWRRWREASAAVQQAMSWQPSTGRPLAVHVWPTLCIPGLVVD
ncbi:hypothetical protein [Streptomyces bauhiniae]|uniref:hypothetical protein n=1 Tax=Streptomyces bauhiniae TaxID=2340725 RepID=UPI0038000364